MSGTLLVPGAPQPTRSRFFVLRSGRTIYMDELRPEYERDRRLAGARYYQGTHRILVRATRAYNCAAHAFGNRRGVLLDGLRDDPEPFFQGAISTRRDFHDLIMRILQEDGYSARTVGRPCAGDIVLYGRQADDILHVGVATGCDHPMLNVPMVLSQFGEGGEFLHGIDDVPEEQLGKVQGVWTQGDGR